MALGQFTLQLNGTRLAMAMGFNHVTAQQKRSLGASSDFGIEESVHYRLVTDSDFTPNGFDFSSVVGVNGHFVSSLNVVNIHGNDSVCIRVPSLGSNGFETLSGSKTNVMGLVAMSADDNSIVFHQPSHPFSVISVASQFPTCRF